MSGNRRDVDTDADKENENPVEIAEEATSKDSRARRDFFGRVISDYRPKSSGKGSGVQTAKKEVQDEGRVWVSFHEGFSNAVRKPITLRELMESF